MEVKDVLHLYLGCECAVDYRDREGEGMMIDRISGVYEDGSAAISNGYIEPISKLKPILRPLSDMTEDEAVELANIHKYDIPDDDGVREELINVYSDEGELHLGKPYLPIGMYKEGMLWLLKQHFDLFSLIESGQAIDKTNQKKQS